MYVKTGLYLGTNNKLFSVANKPLLVWSHNNSGKQNTNVSFSFRHYKCTWVYLSSVKRAPTIIGINLCTAWMHIYTTTYFIKNCNTYKLKVGEQTSFRTG